MARTVVPARPAALAPPTESPPAKGAPAKGVAVEAAPLPGAAETTTGDDYQSKLVKYVPAEVLAFFAPMAAAVDGRTGLVIAATLIALLATPLYLWFTARNLPDDKKPMAHLYPLSAVAFLAWALGTSSIGSLVGLDSVTTGFVLGVCVFLLPLIDGLLETRARKMAAA